jgi:uncharacterized membrane protein YbaN (DUF454 family)
MPAMMMANMIMMNRVHEYDNDSHTPDAARVMIIMLVSMIMGLMKRRTVMPIMTSMMYVIALMLIMPMLWYPRR